MGYTKIISYSDTVEIFEYERYTRNSRSKRVRVQDSVTGLDVSSSGQGARQQIERTKVRTKRSIRSSVLAFKRLVASNCAKSDKPVLASLTYAKDSGGLKSARKDFNAFARCLKGRFGKRIRYICVPEWQKRGEIHFHALIWGIPIKVVRQERATRELAGFWGKGFIDLVQTDGSPRLATYLSKYLSKTFLDPRLFAMKAFIASRNVKRPFIDKNALLLPYYYGLNGVDLSTYEIDYQKQYDTVWLGRASYKVYKKK